MNTNQSIRSMILALVVALLPTSGVWGQEIPIPVVDPDEFISGFEGPIMEINAAAQCVNVMGSDVFIPDALVIDGTVGITGATLNDLLDENAPSRARSVFAGISPIGNPYSGGTFKGLFVYRDGLPICTELVIELAENVAAGTVQNVDVEAKTFSLNGVPCVMNADERFPTEILGIGLEPITFDDVKAAEGIADMTGIGISCPQTPEVGNKAPTKATATAIERTQRFVIILLSPTLVCFLFSSCQKLCCGFGQIRPV